MKTAYSLLAHASVALFAGLVGGAVFDMLYMHNHVSIPLPIPPEHVQSVMRLDTVQLDCMARDIFYEARGEKAMGKAMVGMAVLERTKSPHFPSTVCAVVKQGNVDDYGRKIRNQCSFSWTCDGKYHDDNFSEPTKQKEWEQSYIVAKLVMEGKIHVPFNTRGMTFYHALSVHPTWARDHKEYKVVAVVGHHVFYRWTKARTPRHDEQLASI